MRRVVIGHRWGACSDFQRTVERDCVTTLHTILSVGTAAIVLVGVLSALRSGARRKRMYAEAIERFVHHSTPALDPRGSDQGTNAPAWYLSGVQALRDGRTRDAVRAFGIAHHADCNLVTAALLTFGGLKASSTPAGDLIHEIVKTWHEMKCPSLRASKADVLMLSAMQRTAPPAPVGSELAGFIWVVVGPEERERLIQLMQSGPEWTSALRESWQVET
jgi:hypothetical protein